jgi:hypothetical protein
MSAALQGRIYEGKACNGERPIARILVEPEAAMLNGSAGVYRNLSGSLFFAKILPRMARMTRIKSAPLESISHPCDPCHPW